MSEREGGDREEREKREREFEREQREAKAVFERELQEIKDKRRILQADADLQAQSYATRQQSFEYSMRQSNGTILGWLRPAELQT